MIYPHHVSPCKYSAFIFSSTTDIPALCTLRDISIVARARCCTETHDIHIHYERRRRRHLYTLVFAIIDRGFTLIERQRGDSRKRSRERRRRGETRSGTKSVTRCLFTSCWRDVVNYSNVLPGQVTDYTDLGGTALLF